MLFVLSGGHWLKDHFHRLGLRRRGRCLLEPADDGAPRQFDLEAVMCKAGSPLQDGVGRHAEGFPPGRLALETLFSAGYAPRFMRNPAKRNARFLDAAALELETDRDGNQRKGVGQTDP